MKISVLFCCFAMLLLVSCRGNSPNDKSGSAGAVSQSQAKTPLETASQAGDAGFAVKVFKDGVEFAVYQQAGAVGSSAMLDGDLLQIFLASPDNQNVLTISVQGNADGVYPLAVQYEAPKSGESSLNFMTDPPPVLIPGQGEVTLTACGPDACSGTFAGSGTDIDGIEFSIEGSFNDLAIETIE